MSFYVILFHFISVQLLTSFLHFLFMHFIQIILCISIISFISSISCIHSFVWSFHFIDISMSLHFCFLCSFLFLHSLVHVSFHSPFMIFTCFLNSFIVSLQIYLISCHFHSRWFVSFRFVPSFESCNFIHSYKHAFKCSVIHSVIGLCVFSFMHFIHSFAHSVHAFIPFQSSPLGSFIHNQFSETQLNTGQFDSLRFTHSCFTLSLSHLLTHCSFTELFPVMSFIHSTISCVHPFNHRSIQPSIHPPTHSFLSSFHLVMPPPNAVTNESLLSLNQLSCMRFIFCL